MMRVKGETTVATQGGGEGRGREAKEGILAVVSTISLLGRDCKLQVEKLLVEQFFHLDFNHVYLR